MKRLAAVVACGVMLAAFSGCLIPKEFEAKLNVKKDGSYEFNYTGTILNLLMLAEAEEGRMNEKSEKDMADQTIAELSKDQKFSDISYVGNCQFKLTYRMQSTIKDDPVVMGSREMPIFVLAESEDGKTVSFDFMPGAAEGLLDEKTPQMARDMKGTIELATEFDVVSSVGDPSKAWFSSTYTWKISGVTESLPAMVMKK